MSQTAYLYAGHNYGMPTASLPACEDYRKLVACLWVSAIACFLAAMLYLFLRDPLLPGLLAGTVVVVLTLYHPAFGLFVLFALYAIETAVEITPYFTISKAMGIVVGVSFVLHSFSERLIVTGPLKVAAVLTLWALLSSLWSLLPSYTALTCLTLVLNAALIFIILNTVKDSRSLRLTLWGFALGAFVASCMVVSGQRTQLSQHAIQRASLGGTDHPVAVALAIGMGFLAVTFSFFQAGMFKKIFAGVLLALFFGAMVETQSRMPTMASLTVPVVALILCSKREYRLKYLIIAVVLAIAAYGAVWMVLQSDLLTDAEKERIYSQGLEGSGRLDFWKMGLTALAHRPLHGYGANNFAMIPGNAHNFAAHNTFVAFAVDLGLIGFIMLMTMLVLLYRQVRSISDIQLKWLGVATFCFPLMTGLTVTNYIKRDFWYSLGIAMAAVQISKRQEEAAAGPLAQQYGPPGLLTR